jgi:hypothetical protein
MNSVVTGLSSFNEALVKVAVGVLISLCHLVQGVRKLRSRRL